MPISQGRQLSQQDRLYIFRTVSALVSVQFDELAFSLAPPPGVIPTNGSQGEKSKALLEWVESPTGPGLEAVDRHLQSIIPPDNKSLTAITIPGVDINSLTYEQKIRLVESIEEITGVKVELLEEGSIRVIVSGSEEELQRLQQVFESGGLNQALGGFPVESIQPVDSGTTEARKARLVNAIRIKSKQALIPILFRVRVHALDRDRAFARDIVHTLNLALVIARDIARALDHIRDINRDIDIDIARACDIARDINRDIARAIDIAIVLAHDIVINQDIALAIDHALALAIALVRDIDYAIDHAINRSSVEDLELIRDKIYLTNDLDLSNINLSGADLRNLYLLGANLTDTNLTSALVQGATFGSNRGLSPSYKADLQRRGAVFQDPPTSDASSLVLR